MCNSNPKSVAQDDYDDNAATMSSQSIEYVASVPNLEDSGSYSCSFKFNKWRLNSNLRFPGLMLFLVLCARQLLLFEPALRSHGDRPDMLDTLEDKGSFLRIGRESGVVLDTLKCEGAFRFDGRVDMLDTLIDVMIPSLNVGCATAFYPKTEPMYF